MQPQADGDPKVARRDEEWARAQFWIDETAQVLRGAIASLPDCLPLRSLADRFRQEVDRRA